MKIDHISLWDMRIPFTMNVVHGTAKRSFSDSLVFMVKSRNACGYGEIIIRDYVSGKIGSGEDRLAQVCQRIANLIDPIRGFEIGWPEVQTFLETVACEKKELPLICGIETALCDLICREQNLDVYQLLKMEPESSQVRYGGILPIMSLDICQTILQQSLQLKLKTIRVKLGADLQYNEQILHLCRKILGNEYLLRADANCSWTRDTIEQQLNICEKYKVKIIEQPLWPGEDANTILIDFNKNKGFSFMADESIVTAQDLNTISSSKQYQLLNLRLSKNGGLSRLLKLAKTASTKGIDYQIGCHVGETGILSAVGRVAASLLPDAVCVDGSYDEYLLQDNITTENFSFGHGGLAPIKRGNGLGYSVDDEKLVYLSKQRMEC